MFRQSSTPYWGSSFRSLTSAAAFSVVLASVGPAMAFIKMPMMLDAVTAAEVIQSKDTIISLPRFPAFLRPAGHPRCGPRIA